MGKHSNKEAYLKRLQELAQVKGKASVNETKNRTSGTLIDFKTAADGYTYGIVKENHHYYIKKSNKSENPNITDFTYIGGLGNITEYQYGKLSEADKNRNMILSTINEAYSHKMSTTGSIGKLNKTTKKGMLSEGVDEDAEQEIAQAEEKFDDLESATAAKAEPAPEMPAPDMGGGDDFPAEEPAPDMGGEEGGEEMPDMDGEEPVPDMGGEEIPAEEPAPEGGEEMPDMGGEEAPEGGEEMPDLDGLSLDGEEGGEEMPDLDGEEAPAEEPEGEEGDEEGLDSQDQDSLVTKEIEKSIGKLGNRIRKTELTDSQTISYLKQLISPFKNHVKDVEIEDRKEIADLILKTVPDEDIDDLDVSGEEDMELGEEKDMCAECGNFVQYAESRGYTNESILEATNEEIANLTAGYINAKNEGLNEGDTESVSAHLTPEACDMLKEEYGFDDEDLDEYRTTLNEMDGDQRIEKINEFWGGLKNLGKAAGQGIKKGVVDVGNKVADTTKKAGQAIGQAAQKGAQAVGQVAKDAGQGIKQSYYKGEVNPHVDKMEKAAKELQTALQGYNSVLQKAGQQPVEVNDLLADIFGGIGTPSAPQTKSNKDMTASQKAAWQAGKGAQPAGVDLSQYKNETEEVEESLDDPAKVEVQPTFAQESQSLGVMNESEQKVRKYVRMRLEEKMGLRKAKINESAKSESLKKLDSLIDKQFKLYETVVKNKKK